MRDSWQLRHRAAHRDTQAIKACRTDWVVTACADPTQYTPTHAFIAVCRILSSPHLRPMNPQKDIMAAPAFCSRCAPSPMNARPDRLACQSPSKRHKKWGHTGVALSNQTSIVLLPPGTLMTPLAKSAQHHHAGHSSMQITTTTLESPHLVNDA